LGYRIPPCWGGRAILTLIMGLVTLSGPIAAEPLADGPSIRVVAGKSGRPKALEAIGLYAPRLAKIADADGADGDFARLLSVYVADEGATPDQPAVAGKYTVRGTVLRFTPRYPFRAGMRYRAVLRPDTVSAESGTNSSAAAAGTKAITRDLTIAEESTGNPAEVVQVYPTAAVLPENQLRFYIHFSAPMGRGEVYQHVRLLNSKGDLVVTPFLEVGEELWDAGARRLTLLIDPGRIKRGLKPREDLGPVLEAGQEYTLAIDRTWRDASGRELKADFKKRFRVGPPVEVAIDPAKWQIVPPSDSTATLVVKFPRPLDHALLERTIGVADSKGIRIAGTVTVTDEDRRWEFRPEIPWSAGRYNLVVETTLEDVAGNRIGRAFEVDQTGPLDRKIPVETVKIPFTAVAR
jgi:hypothetical protein